MISAKEAADQVQRLSGLDFYPRGDDQKAALKELRLAVEVAETEGIAKKVIDEVMQSFREAPKPAELRRMLYEENSKHREHRAHCGSCGGSGFITRWYLITYKGNSLVVDRSELLKFTRAEEASAFAAEIAANPGTLNQTVITAASECACRKAA